MSKDNIWATSTSRDFLVFRSAIVITWLVRKEFSSCIPSDCRARTRSKICRKQTFNRCARFAFTLLCRWHKKNVFEAIKRLISLPLTIHIVRRQIVCWAKIAKPNNKRELCKNRRERSLWCWAVHAHECTLTERRKWQWRYKNNSTMSQTITKRRLGNNRYEKHHKISVFIGHGVSQSRHHHQSRQTLLIEFRITQPTNHNFVFNFNLESIARRVLRNFIMLCSYGRRVH